MFGIIGNMESATGIKAFGFVHGLLFAIFCPKNHLYGKKMLQPLNDIVFVQREPMPEVSAGGILLIAREDTKDRHRRTLNDFAKVIAVGSKCLEVKVGDRIYLGEWLGHDCEYQGVKYQAVHEKDIPAIVE